MSSPDPPKRVRLAERPRTGTCELADRIARCAIDAYTAQRARSSVPKDDVPLRTVLAAFVLVDEHTREMTCLALGVGTKTFGRRVDTRGRRLQDCHAEVLARRALKKFLFADVARALRGDVGVYLDKARTDGRVEPREGMVLHFYVSSAPCGNACVRKWAKGRRSGRRDELGEWGWPTEEHVPLDLSAVDSGQTALCVKTIKASKHEPVPEYLAKMIERGELAPGTQPARGLSSECLTCSDKLCVWNIVGYQGALLRFWVTTPIYIKTITVGRKFSEPHLARAVCCRGANFQTEDGFFRAQHPALMETSVVFDNSPMDVDEGAVFDNPFAMVWCHGDDEPEVLNGKIGNFPDVDEDCSDGRCSSVSKAAFFETYTSLRGKDTPNDYDPAMYTSAKIDADSTYHSAKEQLFKHPKMFEPRRGEMGWNAKKSLRWCGYERNLFF